MSTPTIRVLLLSAVAFLATSVTAQDLSIRALTNASTVSRSGSSSDAQTIRVGSTVNYNEAKPTAAMFPSKFSYVSGPNGTASLSLRAGASPLEIVPGRGFLRGLNASFHYLGQTSGNGKVATASSSSASAVSFLVTFRQPRTVRGDLILAWSAGANPSSRWTAAVDIGNDGKVEMQVDSATTSSRVLDRGVAFTNGSIDVKVTFSGTGTKAPATLFRSFQKLSISLVRKGSCTLTPYGSACNGAALDAGMLTIGGKSVLSTRLKGSAPNSFVLRVVGSQRANIPLPGNCRLLCDPATVQLLRADSQGGLVESFFVPANRNFQVNFQYVPFELAGSQIKARASKAWEMKCSGF